LQQAASGRAAELDLARALRREAELLDKRKNQSDWVKARDLLKEATRILEPLVADEEAKLELGRVLTVFCEVRVAELRGDVVAEGDSSDQQ
jgi:hypothetical protein